jgi:hypothetical protein
MRQSLVPYRTTFSTSIFPILDHEIFWETDFGVDKLSGKASRVVLEEINAAGVEGIDHDLG